jgi:hypothetical protein
MRRRHLLWFGGLLVLAPWAGGAVVPMREEVSQEQVISQVGPAARARLRPRFDFAGVPYPPSGLRLLAFKAERRLEVWAARPPGWVMVREYPIRGASGRAGPKLREGDRQVPEGFYRIVLLNPNSRYHLSLRLDYPNAFDRQYAKAEGRHAPGGDIYLHGGQESVGCLALGDPAIEELFTLIYDSGMARAEVWILPHDPRQAPLAPPPDAPPWVADLYQGLERESRSLFGE